MTARLKIKESAFQRTVIKAAQALGWMVHHVRANINRSGKWSTAVHGDNGFPDLVLLHARTGMLLFAELKAETGELSEAQVKWKHAFMAHETLEAPQYDRYRVWRPSDWAAIEAILKYPNKGRF